MQRKSKAAFTTYRAAGKVISTDPSGLKGDTTTWEYDLATGLELRKTYADGKGTVKTYDAYNNLATVTDARGVVATYTYNLNRGLLTSINFSDGTPAQKFTYNFLGQLTAVQDASGARSISYGRYGSQLEEVQQIASSRFLLQEQRDTYGRGTGYILKRNGNRQCAASITYGTLGRIALAGFIHAGEEHQFRYGYLAGSNLLQSLAMPNGVTLTQSYEEKRDLLTGMDYVRDNSLITQRQYNYDALGRPVTRDTRYPNKAIHHNDTFAYNKRSELTGALLDENAYTYAYDNIGNREIAQEVAEGITYAANDLNQYTRISTNGENFTPEYDADGNQILIQTSTGIWKVQYNAQNRAIKFESEDGHTVITCGYDYMGRRFEKKVVTNGTTTLHERYIYRGYLQIAAYDLREGHAEHPDLRFIIWDPTQEVATRPLAIRENGVWYTYGWDLTKNICELYGQEGFIRTIYTYSPYGQVTAEGDVTQCIQWSSEMYDAELGLVYYNFRYYDPQDGRWTRRDPRKTLSNTIGLYRYCSNDSIRRNDNLGLWSAPGWEGAQAVYYREEYGHRSAQFVDCDSKCPLGSVTRFSAEKGCCVYRTKKKNKEYKATANGCGSSWNELIVPDEYPPISVVAQFSFESACNQHDLCYGECGSDKQRCDSMFYENMKQECQKLAQERGVNDEVAGFCYVMATIYYNAVHEFADGAYEDAQNDACLWESCHK